MMMILAAQIFFFSTIAFAERCDYLLPKVLNPEQISEFLEQGYLVVNVLDENEIEQAMAGATRTLERFGFQSENLAGSVGSLQRVSSGVGGIIETYYDEWKLNLMTHPRVFSVISDIWAATYAPSNTTGFEQPFGPFDPTRGYLYVDRWAYRIPQSYVEQFGPSVYGTPLQYGLHAHFDADPLDLFGCSRRSREDPRGIPPRWRPVQAFVSLTDTLLENSGGFEAVPGFHKIFHEYFSDTSGNKVGQSHGEFYNLIPGHHDEIIHRLRHVPVKKGDLVLWDWRLPHRNAALHLGPDPRVVVYTGFLPDAKINHIYAAEQRDAIRDGDPPPDFFSTPSEIISPVPQSYEMSAISLQLFGECLLVNPDDFL